MFSSSTEPVVGDDWLRRIGRELTTAGCTDAEKVHFAAHQLDGPATSWWVSVLKLADLGKGVPNCASRRMVTGDKGHDVLPWFGPS